MAIEKIDPDITGNPYATHWYTGQYVYCGCEGRRYQPVYTDGRERYMYCAACDQHWKVADAPAPD